MLRQRTVLFIDSGLNGGLTTMISAGEVHPPRRPTDIVGLKALAIVAAKLYANRRPRGVKVRSGAPILERGRVEEAFAAPAEADVRPVGEIGLGSVRTSRRRQTGCPARGPRATLPRNEAIPAIANRDASAANGSRPAPASAPSP